MPSAKLSKLWAKLVQKSVAEGGEIFEMRKGRAGWPRGRNGEAMERENVGGLREESGTTKGRLIIIFTVAVVIVNVKGRGRMEDQPCKVDWWKAFRKAAFTERLRRIPRPPTCDCAHTSLDFHCD